MWYEENFIELASLLYEKLFDSFILFVDQINHLFKKYYSKFKKDYFIDCSNKDLGGLILAIKNSDFFIGNNSGPLNLSAALDVKTFGLIANDPVSELSNSKIIPITPKDYVDNIWNRNREGMKQLKTHDVFNFGISESQN